MEQDKQLTELGVLSSIPASGAEIYVRDGNEPIDANKDKRLDLNVVQSQLDGKAPTVHTHVKADITDFAHTHPISDVVNLQTELDGKANTVHTHTLSEITDASTIRQVPVGGTTGQVVTKTASGYDWAEAAAGGGITKGTTAERPANPTEGDLYLDTQTDQLLLWDGFSWNEVVNYTPKINVQYLVIAGGGGGGRTGAGGAGGYRANRTGDSSGGGALAEPAMVLNIGSNYNVSVGAGGLSPAANVNAQGGDGSNSVFHTITSIGGGGGASLSTPQGRSGGSGGGSYNNATAGAGTTNQGYNGGVSLDTNSVGSGGGAGQVGGNNPATGGDGVASTITGTSVFRAGGGGGVIGFTNYVGGVGGGGTASNGTIDANNGQTNTGSGGGSAAGSRKGGNGGSGVVILRYPDTYTITGGTGLTFSTAIDGTDKVTTFTAGSGNIQFTV